MINAEAMATAVSELRYYVSALEGIAGGIAGVQVTIELSTLDEYVKDLENAMAEEESEAEYFAREETEIANRETEEDRATWSRLDNP